jgi:hypothetical protein
LRFLFCREPVEPPAYVHKAQSECENWNPKETFLAAGSYIVRSHGGFFRFRNNATAARLG